MKEITPQYLLATESRSHIEGGHWRFVLQRIEGGEQITASDFEVSQVGDRVALLAVIRGLEALPEPARVVLLSDSRYFHRGLRYGLPAWEQSQWRWERFGRKVPVKNWDLWSRVAHAMKFHQIRARSWGDIRIPGMDCDWKPLTGGSRISQFDSLMRAIRENLEVPQWQNEEEEAESEPMLARFDSRMGDPHLACA
ncbi:MAG: RNase H family protein [Pirellulaceae bacterium]